MEQNKNKTLQLKCFLLDSDGAVRDENDIKVIEWEKPDTSRTRQMLLEKLRNAFDYVQWPFNTTIRGRFEFFLFLFISKMLTVL